MPFHPGIKSWCGVGKAHLWPAAHQGKCRAKGAFCGLPGVSNRPKPGQIEMGVTEPMQGTSGRCRLLQVRRHGQMRLCAAGIQVRPTRRQITARSQMQFQRRRDERAIRIGATRLRLQIQVAADQSSIVMQWAAQFQLKMQRSSLATSVREGPAAGGIEEISLMNQHAVNPEPHPLGPPAQHQSRTTRSTVTPVVWPHQPRLKPKPLTPPWPDQQTTFGPIRAMRRSPGFIEKNTSLGGT